MSKPSTTAIHGPWVAEPQVCEDTEERGLAVIAILPELERTLGATPTRGMVAWVHSGIGACATDPQAVATAKLIAAAPDLLAALKGVIRVADRKTVELDAARAAIAKAEGSGQ